MPDPPINRVEWPNRQRYSEWSTEIRSVRAAFLAGKLLPSRAIRVIRAQTAASLFIDFARGHWQANALIQHGAFPAKE
jgi:hypothetical protein